MELEKLTPKLSQEKKMNNDNENILRTVFEDLAHQICKLPIRLSSLYDMESMVGTDK